MKLLFFGLYKIDILFIEHLHHTYPKPKVSILYMLTVTFDGNRFAGNYEVSC